MSMSIIVIKLCTERDRCKMSTITAEKKTSFSKSRSKIDREKTQRPHTVIKDSQASSTKVCYRVLGRNGQIYLQSPSKAKQLLPLNQASVKQISPGSKIIIDSKGMSRVQVASIVKMISESTKSTDS